MESAQGFRSMDSSSRLPGVADFSRATPRSGLTVSAGASSRSSPRARKDILPTFDKAVNSSLRTSLFSRNAPNFKTRREGRGVGSLMTRWQSYCEVGRRFLPWILLILVWFFIGFRLHISWSEGELQGLSGSRNGSEYTTARFPHEIAHKKLRLKGWLSEWIPEKIGSDSDDALEHAKGDSDPWILTTHADEDMGADAEDNSKIPLDDDDVDGIAEHVIGAGSHINHSNRLFFGKVVGPFDDLERQVLGIGGDNVRGRACSSRGRFPDFVKRKNFVVVFHELSLTGAPLAMLELASKIVSCGGKVSAVILNKRGGLYKELVQRGITIVRDNYTNSWKAAARADLVVAGSAACNAWIGNKPC